MIWTSYPRYHGHVIRPPSEADSLILQVMYGCSHGDCTFCGSYLGKPFRVRPFTEVVEDVQNLPEGFKRNVTRVFLADGDALAIPKRRMLELLDLLKAEMPSLERVSAYANAHSLLRLSQEDLAEIRQARPRAALPGAGVGRRRDAGVASRRASPSPSRSRAAARRRRPGSRCRSPPSWASAARSARTSTPSGRARRCRPSTRNTSGYCR